MGYDVYDAEGELIRAGICLQKAAEMLGVEPEEIELAIEEFGLCDNHQFVAVGHGDPYPST